MKQLLFLLLIASLICKGQAVDSRSGKAGQKGIAWSEANNWDEAVSLAKSSHKFLFVDVYASWCGPCKMMDRNVYSNDTVAGVMNADFVSVRVQMDTTDKDNDRVKSWHSFAGVINEQYKPEGYPTFLFFSPDGKLVDKGLGYTSSALFTAMAKAALTDPIGKYKRAVDLFREGQLEYARMPELAALAKKKKEDELATEIATAYKEKWLDQQPDRIAFSRDNLLLIAGFYRSLIHSGDRYFNLFREHSHYADSILSGPRQYYTSDMIVRGIVVKEEVTDKIYRKGKPITDPAPDWEKLQAGIAQKYGSAYAAAFFPDQQIAFYFKAADWRNYVKWVDQKIKLIPPRVNGKLFGPQFGDAFGLNIYAWDMFLVCEDKEALEKALKWSDRAIALETQVLAKANLMDTKANILYRIGRTKEAIALEEKVVGVGGAYFANNLTKMKQGLPTWLESTHDYSQAGKPVLDTTTFNDWPEVSGGAISNDGRYVLYLTERKNTYTYDPKVLTTITTVQNAKGPWKVALAGVERVQFSADSRYAVFKKPGDTLCLLTLGGDIYARIPDVLSFQLAPYDRGEWLVYQQPHKTLTVRDMKTQREQRFEQVNQYTLSADGRIMALSIGGSGENRVDVVDLFTGDRRMIWSDTEASAVSFLFDKMGQQLAFVVQDKHGRSVWHYQMKGEQANRLAADGADGMDGDLALGDLQRFTGDGGRLFLTLVKKQEVSRPRPDAVKLTVWSYDDLLLQPEQQKIAAGKISLLSVMDVRTGRITQLQHKYDRLHPGMANDDYILMANFYNGADDEVVTDSRMGFNWAPYSLANARLYLVSARDGARRELPWKDGFISHTYLSPGGKYILFKRDSILQYYSYELATGIVSNITKDIPTDLSEDDGYHGERFKLMNPPGGWLKDDAGVFIYDRNDIWLVDPSGRRKAENITNGYGLRNGILLRLEKPDAMAVIAYEGKRLILGAINLRTKDDGYYSIVPGERKDPEKLIMESYQDTQPPFYSNFGANLIKAKNADAWLLTRQTASESPNYFYTTDLRSMKRISDNYPEKAWNWMTAELHSWVAFDGDSLQGILYKPENFDPSKKYPIILQYYRSVSQGLHSYIEPAGNDGYLNIPWCTSHGYLVFTPDIHFNGTELRESILNCVLSARNYLSGLPYIDTTAMGLYGHSFGGLETGELITSGATFAAAISASGYYDFISDLGTIVGPTGGARTTSEGNMGGSLWEEPKRYVKNSSIFYLDKVTTPVLLFTGEKDSEVPHEQTVELFIGLRRLGKRAWMLSYDDGDHSIFSKKEVDDFTIRSTQYFDHYLKHAPAPLWMTKGIPADKKGVITGYELDPLGSCGKDCKICKKWNKK